MTVATKNGKRELPINRDSEHPTFTTKSGVVLKLRTLKALAIAFWDETYSRHHPQPEPPFITLENGDKYQNTKDEWFLVLHEQWTTAYRYASLRFIFEAGVASEPPKGWTPAIPLEGISLKVQWLIETLDNDELDALSEAITSIDVATAEAIEEAEKN